MVKTDGDLVTHVIANAGGLEQAEAGGQALDVTEIVKAVVEALDVPSMIEAATVQVRKALDLVEIDATEIAAAYVAAVEEAS